MDKKKVILVGLATSATGMARALQIASQEFKLQVTSDVPEIDFERIKEQYNLVCNFRDVDFECDVNHRLPNSAHPQPFYRKGRW